MKLQFAQRMLKSKKSFIREILKVSSERVHSLIQALQMKHLVRLVEFKRLLERSGPH